MTGGAQGLYRIHERKCFARNRPRDHGESRQRDVMRDGGESHFGVHGGRGGGSGGGSGGRGGNGDAHPAVVFAVVTEFDNVLHRSLRHMHEPVARLGMNMKFPGGLGLLLVLVKAQHKMAVNRLGVVVA